MMRFFPIFVWMVVLFGAECVQARVFDPKVCAGYLAALGRKQVGTVIQGLPTEQRRFIEEQLLGSVGQRTLLKDRFTSRKWTAHPKGVTLSGFGEGQDIHLRWVNRAENPHFRMESNGNRTLFIPEGFDFNVLPDKGQGFVLRALRGHTLNPYGGSANARAEREALGEPVLLLKQVQQEAVGAFRAAMAEGDDTFLFVGPTGVGKTKVLEGMLKDRLDANAKALVKAKKGETVPSLHIVFADQDGLVDQLNGNIMKMDLPTAYDLIRWGGQKENPGDPMTIEALTEHMQQTGRPLILVTTTRSLVSRVGKKADPNREYNLEHLKENVAEMVMDEAHHVGAPQTIDLVDDIRGYDRSSQTFSIPQDKRPKFLALTATPTRQDMDLVDHIFHGRAFWGYLDTAQGYQATRGQMDRSVADILRQLQTAIANGESHPFRTWFFDPEKFEASGEPLFVSEGTKGKRFYLNPKHYDNFVKAMKPVIENNDHLFFTCASVDEAENLARFIEPKGLVQANGKPHKAGVLHSYMTKNEKERIRSEFESGKISMLFTVGMMDEGIDVPSLTAYIDTTRQTNPKELIQRIGRILRLKEGKVKRSDVVSFQRVTDAETADALIALDNIGKQDWGEIQGGEGGKGIVMPTEFAAEVSWTAQDLENAKRRFFSAPRNKVATEKFERAEKHFRQKGKLDGIARPAERVTHDALAELLDSDSPAVNTLLVEAAKDPLLSQHLQEFRARRDEWKRKLQTAQGVAELVVKMFNEHQRLPRDGKGTQDEKNLLEAIPKNREKLPFLLTTTQRLPAAELAKLEIPDAITRILSEEPRLLAHVDEFYSAHERFPDPKAGGYEGLLGKAVVALVDSGKTRHTDDEFGDLISKLQNDAVQYELLDRFERSRKPAAPAPSTEGKSSVTGKAQDAETPASQFRERFSRLDRAQVGLPAPQKKVRVRLRGSGAAVNQMVEFYRGVADALGLKINRPAGGKDGVLYTQDLEIDSADSGVFPSDAFAFETGMHKITYTDNGKPFTSNVRVEVQGIGLPPKQNDPPIRKYQTHGHSSTFQDGSGDMIRFRGVENYPAPYLRTYLERINKNSTSSSGVDSLR